MDVNRRRRAEASIYQAYLNLIEADDDLGYLGDGNAESLVAEMSYRVYALYIKILEAHGRRLGPPR